ncbi:aspartate ammonia-lyase [Anaerocolumna sp. AGMB13020]|uniref:aspartate ammonia-lyase n=1 Tax=Anaerocolumna sp. AGMB13020 TaxID=3081750 RepID=UPI002952A772|nr:aspartate ammonia-lyase [Anaerocolumna sp. AGMB13020]WOO35348.1 aspartate ammonia-lyase [Anaerocolumna sp. AGMB13020]
MRIEADSMGSMAIPKDAYYGVQSLRGRNNFIMTGRPLNPFFISNLAKIKKAAALTNYEGGFLPEEKAGSIIKACEEIINGSFREQFIVDAIQGGAGTSANMNANEVIANRAIELLGGMKGNYSIIHPNDHVNMAQSTNDVIPSAGKMTVLELIVKAVAELKKLSEAFANKAEEFDHILKMGRTQLQDAVPMRLGQTFQAFSTAINRDIARLKVAGEEMLTLNLGGTAIGSGLNASPYYYSNIIPNLNRLCMINYKQAADMFDATQNLDGFVQVSGCLKSCAVNLSKISNDLRLLSSGPRTGLGEINLPALQNGSSIMPGKVNPVIPEVVNQAAFQIIGNDAAITWAAGSGQLELNAFEPVVFYNLFESLELLRQAAFTLTNLCVSGITANEEHCKALLDNSVSIATALCPVTGYEEAARIAKTALKKGVSVKDLVREEGIISEKEIEKIFDLFPMTINPQIKYENKEISLSY